MGFFLQFAFQFSFEKRRFRSISRTTDFGRLVPLPFGAEEGPRKGLPSDAPFGQFCLAAYLPKGMPLAMHRLLDRLTINTWSDETTGKKGDAGPRRIEVMEPSCLRGVRPFRRLGMHPSGPCEVAFCIDKALTQAPFKS